jgi:hypothetical protein
MKGPEWRSMLLNFYSNRGNFEGNVVSALKINDNLATAILAHASILDVRHDGNGDGFLDNPLTQRINLANRWE